MSDSTASNDPFELRRFVEAQEGVYAQALAELKGGRKRSHWMWFVFPQFDGLGVSSTAKHYAIKSLDEARAYLAHPLLGPRLRECADALLKVEGRSAAEIMGSPDDLKLRSCATLFAQITPDDSPFARLLQKYYRNQPDLKTLQLLKATDR